VRFVATALVLSIAGVAAADASAGGFELRLEPSSVDATTGEEGAVSLTIAPAAGYTIDRDGPVRVRVTVEPDKGLELHQTRYRRADAADARADAPRFDLRWRAASAGNYELRIDARFWVCRRYTCRAAVEQRTVPVRITDPPPPEPPADAAPPQ